MKKTIEIIKNHHNVPETLRQSQKEYLKLKKQVKGVLMEGEATIPDIAAKTGIPSDQVLFIVMTMRKFNEVETGELDDKDEYYSYKLKEK